MIPQLLVSNFLICTLIFGNEEQNSHLTAFIRIMTSEYSLQDESGNSETMIHHTYTKHTHHTHAIMHNISAYKETLMSSSSTQRK